ncbi:MAG: pantoate--beta-alanine ligase [Polyangiaceae bacterium]
MTPRVYESVADFRRACDGLRAAGARVGLVPTMGALHAGHLALADFARGHGAVPAVTIFVNPTQFGPNEDFARYPRPFERDLALCAERGVEHVFAPSVSEMYPPAERTRVRVDKLTDVMCGPKRPGHFEGVATIVAKLFNACGPCLAVFGRKDYQQLQVIRRMATDLLLPVEVLGHPIVRESDGLALSSRNVYLSEAERAAAPLIFRELARAARAFRDGERSAAALRKPVEGALGAAGFRVDYVELVGADELEPIDDAGACPERALLAVAAFLGKTRLIDNFVLGEDSLPKASV